MERYEHGGDIYGNPGVTLDFSVNINPLGLPDAVREALVTRVDEYTRYPDQHYRALRTAIAGHEAVPEEMVLCGNGAADLIYRICYALQPRRALIPSPTFSEYEKALTQVGCLVTDYMMTVENGLAITDGILEKIVPGIDVLFLCHPNNPTGLLIHTDLLERILNRTRETGTTVVVDECFLDFKYGNSTKRYLSDIPRLVILKAFTKMYAMAGLRLGYLLTGDEMLLRRITDAAQCWSVSVPAQIAGVAAISCEGWQIETRRLVAEESRFFTESLNRLGITVFPSDANFLLLRSDVPLCEPLLQKGILIRSCENFKGLDNTYFRIGVKTRVENSRLIQAIEEILYG